MSMKSKGNSFFEVDVWSSTYFTLDSPLEEEFGDLSKSQLSQGQILFLVGDT